MADGGGLDLLRDWQSAMTSVIPRQLISPLKRQTELIGDVLRQSFEDVTVVRRAGQARFTSLDDWLYTEIRGWTLAEHIDDDQYARLRRAAATRLARFVTGDGAVRFAVPALIAAASV